MTIRMLTSGLTIGMLVAALALTGGCGDNDNSGNDNGGSPNPTSTPIREPSRTATPAAPTGTPAPGATSTPVASGTRTVEFRCQSTAAIQGFQIRVAYSTATGNFTGSADEVACTANGGGIFVKNDNDTGTLILSVANTTALAFPITISCTYDATTPITGNDFAVTVQEVTENNAPGNVADLTIGVRVP
jgi:hypothetical protein